MKRNRHLSIIFFALLSGMILCRPGSSASKIAPEESIKAAFVFRFAQYTTWPEPLEKEFKLCIFGNSKAAEVIEGYSGRTIQGRRLATIRPGTETIPKGQCHAVFISTKSRTDFRNLVNSRGNRSILLISDVPGAFEENTDIALSTEPNKVTFSINLTQAKSRLFSFSGQMLKLARKIR